jgi:hypothetical protein
MSYHADSSMTFKPNELGHDQNDGIVCSNDSILCTCVPPGKANNVHFGCFHFLRIKNLFSISRESKMIFM